MDHTALFKKKKHNYIKVLTGSIFLFLIYFFFWYEYSMGILFLIAGSIVITLYVNIYRFKNWRCPNCKTFLGESIYIDRCQNCNCSFNVDKSNIKNIYVAQSNLKHETQIINPQIQISKKNT